MRKRLNIHTTIHNGKGMENAYAIEHRPVNWTPKEARKHVMEMAMAYAPESKKYVQQEYSNNELGKVPYVLYQYSVTVRYGNIEKKFEFEYFVKI